MTTSDIQYHINDIYGIDISDTTVNQITDKVLLEAREWQQRPLESVMQSCLWLEIITTFATRAR